MHSTCFSRPVSQTPPGVISIRNWIMARRGAFRASRGKQCQPEWRGTAQNGAEWRRCGTSMARRRASLAPPAAACVRGGGCAPPPNRNMMMIWWLYEARNSRRSSGLRGRPASPTEAARGRQGTARGRQDNAGRTPGCYCHRNWSPPYHGRSKPFEAEV